MCGIGFCFQGVKCPHCNAINHRHCVLAFNKRRKDGQSSKCPSCQEVIVTTPDNDRNDDNDDETPVPKKKGRKQTRRSNSPAQVNGSPPEEDATPGPSRGRKRRGD